MSDVAERVIKIVHDHQGVDEAKQAILDGIERAKNK